MYSAQFTECVCNGKHAVIRIRSAPYHTCRHTCVYIQEGVCAVDAQTAHSGPRALHVALSPRLSSRPKAKPVARRRNREGGARKSRAYTRRIAANAYENYSHPHRQAWLPLTAVSAERSVDVDDEPSAMSSWAVHYPWRFNPHPIVCGTPQLYASGSCSRAYEYSSPRSSRHVHGIMQHGRARWSFPCQGLTLAWAPIPMCLPALALLSLATRPAGH